LDFLFSILDFDPVIPLIRVHAKITKVENFRRSHRTVLAPASEIENRESKITSACG
jgi:hypothetical protein